MTPKLSGESMLCGHPISGQLGITALVSTIAEIMYSVNEMRPGMWNCEIR